VGVLGVLTYLPVLDGGRSDGIKVSTKISPILKPRTIRTSVFYPCCHQEMHFLSIFSVTEAGVSKLKQSFRFVNSAIYGLKR
jgi:hypothetical protein